MYYLYILKCKDGSLYTGITTNVRRRFKEHWNKLGARYTRSHPPEKIVYTEALPTRSAALKREAEIKKWRRAKKLIFIRTHAHARIHIHTTAHKHAHAPKKYAKAG